MKLTFVLSPFTLFDLLVIAPYLQAAQTGGRTLRSLRGKIPRMISKVIFLKDKWPSRWCQRKYSPSGVRADVSWSVSTCFGVGITSLSKQSVICSTLADESVCSHDRPTYDELKALVCIKELVLACLHIVCMYFIPELFEGIV